MLQEIKKLETNKLDLVSMDYGGETIMSFGEMIYIYHSLDCNNERYRKLFIKKHWEYDPENNRFKHGVKNFEELFILLAFLDSLKNLRGDIEEAERGFTAVEALSEEHPAILKKKFGKIKTAQGMIAVARQLGFAA